MAAFSPKAYRLIDLAMCELEDDGARAEWVAWSHDHAERRTANSVTYSEHVPRNVLAAALAALERMSRSLKARLSSNDLDDDDVSDMENDLTYIRTVETSLIRDLDATYAAA